MLSALDMKDEAADIGNRLDGLKRIARGSIEPDGIQDVVTTVGDNQEVMMKSMTPILKALDMD